MDANLTDLSYEIGGGFSHALPKWYVDQISVGKS